MLFLLHLGLEGVTEVDTDPKERFVSFKVTTSNESSLFVPLQGIAAENSLLGGRFFEGLQNYMQNKNEGNENKIIIGDLNCTMDKIDRDGENKAQTLLIDFIGAVPVMPCLNSSWIMGLRIYGEGELRFL